MQSSTMRERANSGVRRRSASFRKVQKYKKQEAREDKVSELSVIAYCKFCMCDLLMKLM